MINEIKYYASQHPELIKDLIVLNAGEDTNKQISDVQDLISRGVDGIVLSPHSNTAFTAVLKDAKEYGIPGRHLQQQHHRGRRPRRRAGHSAV